MIIKVKVKGDKFLMERYPMEQALLQEQRPKKATDITGAPIELFLYKDSSGLIFMPSVWFRKSGLLAARNFKEPGRRGGNYSKSFSASVRIKPAEIIVEPQEWIPFIRPLKLKNGNTVIASTPCFNNWTGSFEIHLIEHMDTDVLKGIYEWAGKYEGIGKWRPNRGGEFGSFEIIQFDVS